MSLDRLKTHQLLALLIPQAQAQSLKAPAEGQRLDGLQEGYGIMKPLQVVIGNHGSKMVSMVQVNVAHEPLQHLGQFVIGGSLQDIFNVPILMAVVHALKLMLDENPIPIVRIRWAPNQNIAQTDVKLAPITPDHEIGNHHAGALLPALCLECWRIKN
jgi:hypothetical protein